MKDSLTHDGARRPRVTFKREKRETGLAGVGYPYQSVTVKADKKQVGTIYAPNWHQDGWRLSLAFKSDCGFAWKFFKAKETEEDARELAMKAVEKYASELYQFEGET